MPLPLRTGAAALSALALCACQSYERRPLDLAAHRDAWTARSPHDESVAAFAARLAGHSSAAEQRAPFDPTDGLSLPEAEAVALVYNPDLRLARLRADVALAGARYAGLWEDPVLGVDLERIVKSVDHPWVIGATLGITIPLSGRTSVERDHATAEHRAALARVAEQEWQTRIALRRAWLEWSAQTVRVELARDLLDRIAAVVQIVDRLEQAGELSRIEARVFRAEHASRRADLRDLEAAAAEMQLTLRSLMGLSPRAPLDLVPAPLLAAAPAETPEIAEISPTLATLRAEYDAAEEALRLEIQKQYPDLVIGPGYGEEDGDGRVLLGLSIPIPLWNRNQRAIAEAAAQRDLARAAFETEYERLSAQLAAARVRLEAATHRRQLLESEAVPLAQTQETEAQRVAALGQVDAPLMLDTLTRLYDVKSALLDARLAEALAALRIEELLGPALAPEAARTEPAPGDVQ